MKRVFLLLVSIGIVYTIHNLYELERLKDLLHKWGQEQAKLSELMNLNR